MDQPSIKYTVSWHVTATQSNMRLTLLSFVSTALALPTALQFRADEPVYWLLAGDSTTATAGGWGDAFLATTVASDSSGKNYGHSGASTKSFRDGGDWGEVIEDVGTHKDDYRVYVTIQVGSLTFGLVFHSLTAKVWPQRPKSYERSYPCRL